MDEDEEFNVTMDQFMASLANVDAIEQTVQVVSHDDVNIGEVSVGQGTNYARLRTAIRQQLSSRLNWCPAVRPGAPPLQVSLDFEFLIPDEPAVGEVEPPALPSYHPLQISSESRAMPAPGAPARVHFLDVFMPGGAGGSRTHTLSPLGPVGSEKARSTTELLQIVQASRAQLPAEEEGEGEDDADGLMEQVSLALGDDSALEGPGVQSQPRQSHSLCPTCLYAHYRRRWLYRDPREKRRIVGVCSSLLLGAILVSSLSLLFTHTLGQGGRATPALTRGSLLFTGKGAGEIESTLFQGVRTVEFWFRLAPAWTSESVSQGLLGYSDRLTPHRVSFSLYIAGVDTDDESIAPEGSVTFQRTEADIENTCASGVYPWGTSQTWHSIALTFSDLDGPALFLDGLPMGLVCAEAVELMLGGPLKVPAGSVALVGARGFTGPSLLSPLSGGIAQLRLWSVPLTLQEFASSGNAQSLQKLGLLVSFPCTLAAVDLETSVVQSVPARGSMSLYGAVNVSESSPPVL